jgi:hypothetical protein
MTWNIWRIKNRWLRAAFMWLVAAALAALCLAVAPIAIAVLAVIGAASGLAGFFRSFRDGASEWRDIFGTAWAAMTGQDAPGGAA